MKKLIIILAAVLSFNAVTAQGRNNNRYNDKDRYQVSTTGEYHHNNNDQWRDRGYNNNGYNNDKYNRQVEYDRMNRQYDQRINGYRNDRSINSYERQRRINEAERERQQKAKSFGTGLVVGGLAALVLGAIISN